MCQIIISHWIPGLGKISRPYVVSKFIFEDNNLWHFTLEKPDENNREIDYAFPKRKNIGEDENKKIIWEYLPEPSFVSKFKTGEVLKSIP